MSKKTETKTGPPVLYDVSAENALLGAAFLDPTVFGNTVPHEDFGVPGYGLLWLACQQLTEKGIMPDLVTLPEGALPEGHTPSGFIDTCPSAVRAEQYAEIVRYWARRRELVEAASLFAQAARSRGSERHAPPGVTTTHRAGAVSRVGR